ncbi:precorrin-2 dehydrogenase/sirohydrochlorin ferrochelatase family protein [[Clostridium] polysaccharolyticum]|uniref:precorrin-2 dehydrogenase n=1 Tax=[Clostridium] polysaccharolyticum TaxID=29364 RepID=A0A1I0B9Z3_9FIRM|nr:bifunctional precorrin-2 dehydrogenase/sirohydrochlorin ferrochelatase [[Clostridium] polysaccharolyticum]SET03617.1 precorrin-2 dehydrogenase / sirohydrochlorin ferrochelatase [[Clostridium] polysaccharolyticum]
MAYFPFFIDIQDKHCLVAGGGAVAYRKVRVLLSFEVYITVVAPVICKELKDLAKTEDRLILLEREFQATDISQSFFVIAATSNSTVNETISTLCKQANTFVNVADSKEKSNFLFPSIIKRGDVVVGTSTSGNSPDVAKWVRTQLEEALPDYVAELTENLGKYRSIIKERVESETARKKAFKELLCLGRKAEGKVEDAMFEQVLKDLEDWNEN